MFCQMIFSPTFHLVQYNYGSISDNEYTDINIIYMAIFQRHCGQLVRTATCHGVGMLSSVLWQEGPCLWRMTKCLELHWLELVRISGK